MSKRGGYRENAQRPPLYEDTMGKFFISLPAEMVEYLDSTGVRDRAANLRNLFDWAAALPESELLHDPGASSSRSHLGRRYALRDDDVAMAARLGDDNRTAGIRRLVFTAMRNQVNLVELQKEQLAAKAL